MAKRTADKAKKDPVLEGELLDPVGQALTKDEDELFVQQAGRTVVELLKGLAGFFTTARVMEEAAIATRDRVRAMQLPASAEEDERLQQQIRKIAGDKRDLLEHWKITATITQFRNRLTARRSKSEDALDEASKRSNALHNQYVEAEQRRVREETRRREEEAEERARQQRAQELAEIERQAVAREEAAKDLSGREQVFVDGMAKHGDGVRAARDAGFPDPLKSSNRLLKLEKIRAAVLALQEAAALRRQQTAAAQKPLEVGPVEPVIPNITKAVGAQSRDYHYGDLVDADALLAAVLSGQHGIPTDILQINPSKVNDYAKDLGPRINRWPGVRYRKETKLV